MMIKNDAASSSSSILNTYTNIVEYRENMVDIFSIYSSHLQQYNNNNNNSKFFRPLPINRTLLLFRYNFL